MDILDIWLFLQWMMNIGKRTGHKVCQECRDAWFMAGCTSGNQTRKIL
ncbi:MAG TPA: hypothetical protein PKN11_08145 [Anaerolineaceae bacterium]|nr:hypothetical protein [Longilinea sp.]HNS64384.1 hypothetical protein [Anaerolineaceae bacterium]HNZ00340.1 hypothetical protein [Anaerolineaceae bacterium]HOD45481.1 hypothetical protein [Anaerolineaceae bacterium]HOH19637.1 hypothetical protein [Anaerolineaceae bacterium]